MPQRINDTKQQGKLVISVGSWQIICKQLQHLNRKVIRTSRVFFESRVRRRKQLTVSTWNIKYNPRAWGDHETDSMLSCVCSVTDHMMSGTDTVRYQKVVHEPEARVSLKWITVMIHESHRCQTLLSGIVLSMIKFTFVFICILLGNTAFLWVVTVNFNFNLIF